jgi:hypothetical protein
MKTLTLTALAVLALTLAVLLGSCNQLNKAFKNIPGKVQGQCFDANGGPRGYVSVVLKKVDTGEEKYRQNAEEAGNFFFDQVEPGKYTFMVYLTGNSSVPIQAKELNVTPGKTVMENITVLDAPPADASGGG